MKTVSCLLCVFALAASHGADGKVQKPFAAAARHYPLKTLGCDYWTILSSAPYTDPGYAVCGVKWGSGWNNASLTNLPVFRDCGVVRRASKPPPDSAGTASAWRTVREGCRDDVWKVIEADAKKDRPAVLVFGGKRHVDAMAGDIDLDHADWEAFKKARPNLIGTRTMCEWGNDLMLMMRRTSNIVNKARRAELESVWARHSFSNRYDRLALSRWYVDRKLKLHYGDMDTFMAFRGMYFLDHVAAAWGAKTLTAETTNTSGGNAEYRWDVSAMFIRGAARQFGVPWCWYAANFFNGPAKDGTWKNNSVSAYRYQRGNGCPEGGTSASAMRRCYYYAYLNGANAVEPESWIGQFFTTNTVSGLAELTGRGKDYSDFHDFTSAHPGRGATYAPVAILTPFAQGYTAYGGKSWSACPYTGGDYALDALFFTISPGWERAKGLAEGRQDGNFNNSRFAMMYDVLVPDSPQPKEEFAKALFSYPAAILVGDYPDPAKFSDVLKAYERAGGKLVRIDPSELPPQRDISDIRAGRVKFPAVERKLEKLQRELFPFAVKGDCQYGANRTSKGWWLWVFNNKGVRKFADTFETIDRTKDAAIEVSFTHATEAPVAELMSGRRIEVNGGKFVFTVPAGDFAVFEISECAASAVPDAK